MCSVISVYLCVLVVPLRWRCPIKKRASQALSHSPSFLLPICPSSEPQDLMTTTVVIVVIVLLRDVEDVVLLLQPHTPPLNDVVLALLTTLSNHDDDIDVTAHHRVAGIGLRS